MKKLISILVGLLLVNSFSYAQSDNYVWETDEANGIICYTYSHSFFGVLSDNFTYYKGYNSFSFILTSPARFNNNSVNVQAYFYSEGVLEKTKAIRCESVKNYSDYIMGEDESVSVWLEKVGDIKFLIPKKEGGNIMLYVKQRK